MAEDPIKTKKPTVKHHLKEKLTIGFRYNLCFILKDISHGSNVEVRMAFFLLSLVASYHGLQQILLYR